MLTAMRAVVAVFFCITLFVLYSATALLRRQNWARRTFVVLFVLGSVWNALVVLAVLAGLLFGLGGSGAQEGVPQSIQAAFSVVFGLFSVFACGVAVLFAWLAIRLRSKAVKAEFHVVPAA
jgi:hypothetical protein